MRPQRIKTSKTQDIKDIKGSSIPLGFGPFIRLSRLVKEIKTSEQSKNQKELFGYSDQKKPSSGGEFLSTRAKRMCFDRYIETNPTSTQSQDKVR